MVYPEFPRQKNAPNMVREQLRAKFEIWIRDEFFASLYCLEAHFEPGQSGRCGMFTTRKLICIKRWLLWSKRLTLGWVTGKTSPPLWRTPAGVAEAATTL